MPTGRRYQQGPLRIDDPVEDRGQVSTDAEQDGPDPVAPAVVGPATAVEASEVDELRLRVAAQDRLIAAMLEENEDIHRLRRRNWELEQRFQRMRSTFPVNVVLGLRRRVRHAMGGGDADGAS